MESPTSPDQTTVDEVFKLLRHKGPLSVTQISADLLLSVRRITPALDNLKENGLVEIRTDEPTPGVWGLRKAKFKLRFPRLRRTLQTPER